MQILDGNTIGSYHGSITEGHGLYRLHAVAKTGRVILIALEENEDGEHAWLRNVGPNSFTHTMITMDN